MQALGTETASPLRRLAALLIDFVLVPLTLIIGYIIWWLLVLGRGQTPGKQILAIRAVRRGGEPTGWGLMFVREVLKWILHAFTLGLVADGIVLLMDEKEHRSVIDRVVDTRVVYCD